MSSTAQPGGFAERVARAPILCDGAMGTELLRRWGLGGERCLDELNLSNRELVKSVHLDYIAAGAEIIETNSFGASRVKLGAHGLEDRAAEINAAAVSIAREARRLTGQRVWIAGSVGPLGRPISPLGTMEPAQARDAFREQVDALAQAGVDLLVLETFTDLREMVEAVTAARLVADLPIVAQMTFTRDGATASGDTISDIVHKLAGLGVTAIGANCSVGSEDMLRVVEQMVAAGSPCVAAQPNAGFPTYEGGRLIYRSSPDYMAAHARRMVAAGAAIVGGCCGTTPEHIAAVRDALQGVRLPRAKEAGRLSGRPRRGAWPETKSREPTGLSLKLGRKFVVTVEVDPPRGFDVAATFEALAQLKASGMVDAINVADNPRASGRMSALAMSTLIQSRLGMETVLHLTLRHRNLLALHSDLMGAHALGVRNLLVVMGDPPSAGDYPSATPVSDIKPSGMVKLIKAFNTGLDLNGKPIEQTTSFYIGCAFSPGAEDLAREVRVLRRKLEAGADFIMTQPVYSGDVLNRALRQLRGSPVPVLVGLLPPRSHSHAEFLHNEVPGIRIPDQFRERLRQAGSNAEEVGLQMCVETLDEVRDKVAGAYVIPPQGRYDVALRLVQAIAR